MFGQQPGQDAAAVQGGDGQEVENAEDKVDPDTGHQHLCQWVEDGDGAAAKGYICGHQDDKFSEDGADHGHYQVGCRTGKGHPEHVLPWIFEIVGVDRDGLGPAESDKEKGDGADGVQVLQGVQCQAAQGLGRGIAEEVSDRAMGELMDGQGKKKRRGQQNKARDIDTVHSGFPYLRVILWFFRRQDICRSD